MSETIESVLDLIKKEPRSVPSMARELGLQESQVYGALHSIRCKHEVKRELTRSYSDTEGYFTHHVENEDAIHNGIFAKGKFSGALYQAIFDILMSYDDDPDKWTIAELTEMLGVSNSQARTAITRIKMKGYIVSSSQSDSDNRLLEYWIDGNDQPELPEPKPRKYPNNRGRKNIELVQSLINQGYSVDDCARLMNDKNRQGRSGNFGFVYWQKRILHLIEIGEVKA